jgi:hypothetical protein
MTVRTVPDLARLDYFQGMDACVLSSVSKRARVQTLAAGEVLFRQGDEENSSAYLLLTGNMSVHCKSEAQMSASNNTLQTAQDAGESSRAGEHVSHRRRRAHAKEAPLATCLLCKAGRYQDVRGFVCAKEIHAGARA